MKEKYCTKLTLKKVKGNKCINAIVGKKFKAREMYVDRNTWAIIIYPQEKSCYKEYKTLEFTNCDDAIATMKKNYEKFYEDGACILKWGGSCNYMFRPVDYDVKKRYTPLPYYLGKEFSYTTRVNVFDEFIKDGMDLRVARILECYFDTIKNLDEAVAKNSYEIRNIKEQLEHIRDDISDIKWLISPYDSIKGRINRERFIAQARKIEIEPSGWSRNTYMLRYEDQRELENMGHHGNITMNP